MRKPKTPKRKIEPKLEDDGTLRQKVPASRSSDEPPTKRAKWTNKQRVLVFASRGITYRDRHLMQNLRTLMPHSKTEPKVEKSLALRNINEICEMKNCNKCIFFETRKQMDLYMWIGNIPQGPSAKFLVENVHTMQELKLTGNCLKGSRPLLSFDPTFDKLASCELLKELFIQTFGTPNQHPKSQPFFDHVFSFTVLDNRIWFRNFQVVEEDASLLEIGPRFVLNPIKIFEGSFTGTVLFSNQSYVTPNLRRRLVKQSTSGKYLNKVEQKKSREERRPTSSYKMDPMDDVFDTLPGKKQFIAHKKRKKPRK